MTDTVTLSLMWDKMQTFVLRLEL